MSYFFDSFVMERQEMAPGITLRTRWGENVMISLVDVAPNTVMDEHSHSNEQAGIMLQGMTAHYLATGSYPLKPGDTALIHAAAGGVAALSPRMQKVRRHRDALRAQLTGSGLHG